MENKTFAEFQVSAGLMLDAVVVPVTNRDLLNVEIPDNTISVQFFDYYNEPYMVDEVPLYESEYKKDISNKIYIDAKIITQKDAKGIVNDRRDLLSQMKREKKEIVLQTLGGKGPYQSPRIGDQIFDTKSKAVTTKFVLK